VTNLLAAIITTNKSVFNSYTVQVIESWIPTLQYKANLPLSR